MKIVKKQHTFKKYIFGFFILLTICSTTEIVTAQIDENFSDGDFTNNPTWSGTSSTYIINSSGQLQLNNTVAATSYLTTPHGLENFNAKEWRFWVRQTFSGSATNYGRIYLTSVSTDLSSNPDGIYIQLGEANATDAVRIMQRNAGTTTQICASTDGSIANSFANGIKIVRSETGVWTLSIDETGGTDYIQVGTGTEVAIPTGDQFGYLNIYTATNSNKFYLDNIYVGTQIVDVNPPIFSTATITDATHLKLTFSEPVSQATAEEISNYTLNPTIGITTATRDLTNPAIVNLTLATSLSNGTTYTISTNNISDLLGNISAIQQQQVTYMLAETPSIGDIIITEFFPDPSPSIGLPEIEFVEIYNASTKYFNLAGWKLGDNSTFGTIQNGWLQPGQYVVLCPAANVTSYTNAIGVTNFPSLNNAADDVKIQDNNGVLLDELSYTLEWYHDASKQDGGWTIERINPSLICSGMHNWKASTNANGGTPGAQNSVFDLTPDTSLPALLSITVLTPNSIKITFNKPINGTSIATTPITINPSLTIASRTIVGAFPSSIELNFNETITAGSIFTITLTDVVDCPGNSATLSGTFLLPGIPVYGDIIINEFMADPTPVVGLPEVEFIEIYNRSNKHFQLNGWKLGDNSTFGTIQNGWIAPGEYKILCATASVTSYPNAIAVTSFPSYGNNGDDIILKTSNDLILDQLTYNIDWYKDLSKKDGGWTIERINPEGTCSNASNWKASTALEGGTPGMQNSVYDTTPDTQAPSISSILTINSKEIEIRFDEPIDSLSFTTAIITTNPALTIANSTITSTYTDKINIAFTTNFITSQLYTLTISGATDCIGNGTAMSGKFVLASPADSGDVVINEILFDPYTGASDWVELYNNSNKVINLKNWKMSRWVNGVISDKKTITQNYFLQPNDYVVIGADSNAVINNYPATVLGKFYQLALPSMPNDAGNIVVQYPVYSATDTTEQIMDQVQYAAGWHFKLIDSKDGKSLERRDPNLPSQNAKNWYTAAENLGFATPGRVNSQYFPAIYTGQMTLASDVISPDNDGFEDILQINYQMETAGMLATIKVFDDRGRAIKTITSNELLGTEGIITWDGIREDGQKAAIGTYVVLMEAFDINGGNEFVSKKAFVVAGKM